MNTSLLVLVVLSLAGLVAKNKTLGRTWCLLGLAGIALLWPTLLRPGTIVSPAGSMAHLPPWQATGDPQDGNAELRDITFQVQPWLIFLRHELRQGRIPFWNPHHYAGMPYWSNGSAAPLFPLHLLFVLLPLELGFVLLPWLRIVLGGCGVWLLARQLGLGSESARLAALIYPLSGMLVSHLLFPMANALLLVPWILWAVERLATGEGSWRPLAILGGLQLIAGHPETALHTCLLTAVYGLCRGGCSFKKWWGGWLTGWTVASLLAAVQILPVALTLFDSTRWMEHSAGLRAALSLTVPQMLRAVLPNLFGMPSHQDFWGPVVYVATAVYISAAALALALAGLGTAARDRRWRALMAVLVVSFLGAYHFPIFYDLLTRLPLVGGAPQHRLIFGIELVLALLAAWGFERWSAGEKLALRKAGLGVLVLLAVAWALFASEWRERGQLGEQAAWTFGVLIVTFALIAVGRAPGAWRERARRWLPVVVVLDLVLAHHAINPPLPLARLYPVTDGVAFLQGREGRVAGLGRALHPNAAMVYDLFDPRGDESIKMARYERYYAELARPERIFSLPIEDWQHPHLDELGVRWILGPPNKAAPVAGWRTVYQGQDAAIYERPTASEVVRWADADRGDDTLTIEDRAPGFWQLSWRSQRARTLVIAECWDPGWRAWVDGRELAVELVDEVFMGIKLDPGAGRLELRYRPQGLAVGLGLSLLGSMLLVPRERTFAAVWQRFRHRAARG